MSARIVTVLRSGGEYTPAHVARLYRQCAGLPFVCISDVDVPAPRIEMQHDWPHWWAKIEVFLQPGPVFYMDLDTAVVGDITHLLKAAANHDFIALRNPLHTPSKFGSGMMSWRGDMRHVYDRFVDNPHAHMRRCKTPARWGDQGFIAETETPDAYWQDIFPDEVVSWKVDCVRGVPETARVVYFHGQPRPWAVGM